MFSYREEARSTHLTSYLFYKDNAGKMDEPDLTENNDDVNLGPKKRASFIKSERREVDKNRFFYLF